MATLPAAQSFALACNGHPLVVKRLRLFRLREHRYHGNSLEGLNQLLKTVERARISRANVKVDHVVQFVCVTTAALRMTSSLRGKAVHHGLGGLVGMATASKQAGSSVNSQQ